MNTSEGTITPKSPVVYQAEVNDPEDNEWALNIRTKITTLATTPVACVGFVFNILTFWVWSGRTDVKPLIFFFKALAVADSTFIFSFTTWFYLPRDKVYALWFVLYLTAFATPFIIVFLTTCITCCRYMAVFHPFAAQRLITMTRCRKALAIYVLFTLVHYGTQITLQEFGQLPNLQNRDILLGYTITTSLLIILPTFLQVLLTLRLVYKVSNMLHNMMMIQMTPLTSLSSKESGSKQRMDINPQPRNSTNGVSWYTTQQKIHLKSCLKKRQAGHSLDTQGSTEQRSLLSTPREHGYLQHCDKSVVEQPVTALSRSLHTSVFTQTEEEQELSNTEQPAEKLVNLGENISHSDTFLAEHEMQGGAWSDDLEMETTFDRDAINHSTQTGEMGTYQRGRTSIWSQSITRQESSYIVLVPKKYGSTPMLPYPSLKRTRWSRDKRRSTVAPQEEDRHRSTKEVMEYALQRRRLSYANQQQLTFAMSCLVLVSFLSYFVMYILELVFRHLPRLAAYKRIVFASESFVSVCNSSINFLFYYRIMAEFRLLFHRKLTNAMRVASTLTSVVETKANPTIYPSTLPEPSSSDSFRRSLNFPGRKFKTSGIDTTHLVHKSSQLV